MDDRRERAREQAAALERARAAEAARAQELIDAFLARAEAEGIAPVPLRATLPGGHRVRTGLEGWYLRRNELLAIGTDGGYYNLSVPGGLRERLAGVRVEPAPPPLVVGRGGRDGESGDLAEYLDRIGR
ncbi:hypothetical protein [Mariniluteicoccus endophyticus]